MLQANTTDKVRALRRRRKPARHTAHCTLESLEPRTLLSANGLTKLPNVKLPTALLPAAPIKSPLKVARLMHAVSSGKVATLSNDVLPAAGDASTSTTQYADPRADVNGDGIVGVMDLSIVANNWQKRSAPGAPPIPGDINGDGVVNMTDFSILASNWGLSVAPAAPTPPEATPAYDWHQATINGTLNIWAPDPGDFGSTYTVTDPTALFGPDGVPQIEAVHQGPISDCYILSAGGSLALNEPSKLTAMIQNDPGGGWAVTFSYFDNTKWQNVPVTIHTSDDLSYSQAVATNGEVWPLVLEKAYAAFRTWNGSTSQNTLASLNFGNPSAALTALNEASSTIYTGSMSQQAIYNTLGADLSAHEPILFQTSNTAPTMVSAHVYAITGESIDANGTMWVTTYNPWGFYDTRTMTDLLQNGLGTIVTGTA